jgi:hypothetical protein
VIEKWNLPHVLGAVQFIMNSEVCKETGMTAYQHVFGTFDAEFFRLPTEDMNNATGSKYLEQLNKLDKADKPLSSS